jgi:hypothetical protein
MSDRERALTVAHQLSRAEHRQLRRGELDADTIRMLMDRTAGLSAPAARPDGELPANGIGWRIGEGGPTRRLHPRLLRGSFWLGMFAYVGSNGATMLGLSPGLAFLVGILPFTTYLGAVCAAAELKVRRLWRAPRAERLDEWPSGTAVRLTGVVVPAATIPSLFRGTPALLFKSAAGGAQRTQGIDFDLDLEGGQRVRVSVRRALLVDRATRTREPPACGPVTTHQHRLTSALFTGPSLWARLFGPFPRFEISIGPGDRVEVCGVLHHEPAPDAQAPFARQMATRAVLRAPRRGLLLVRRLG